MKKTPIMILLMMTVLVGAASATPRLVDDFSEPDGAFGSAQNDQGQSYTGEFTNLAYSGGTLVTSGVLFGHATSNFGSPALEVGESIEIDYDYTAPGSNQGGFYVSRTGLSAATGIGIYYEEGAFGEGNDGVAVKIPGQSAVFSTDFSGRIKITVTAVDEVEISIDDVLITSGTLPVNAAEYTDYHFGADFFTLNAVFDNLEITGEEEVVESTGYTPTYTIEDADDIVADGLGTAGVTFNAFIPVLVIVALLGAGAVYLGIRSRK